eukprot:scaffold4351_cov31-Phaeocystis_antarctica.AAC.1
MRTRARARVRVRVGIRVRCREADGDAEHASLGVELYVLGRVPVASEGALGHLSGSGLGVKVPLIHLDQLDAPLQLTQSLGKRRACHCLPARAARRRYPRLLRLVRVRVGVRVGLGLGLGSGVGLGLGLGLGSGSHGSCACCASSCPSTPAAAAAAKAPPIAALCSTAERRATSSLQW